MSRIIDGWYSLKVRDTDRDPWQCKPTNRGRVNVELCVGP
jgi:hypothetical protein